jgi:hypothetical protein
MTRQKIAVFPRERPIPTYHSYLPKCLKPGQRFRAAVELAIGPGIGLKFGRRYEC